MLDLKGQWNSVADKGKWAARRAALGAKLRATKEVWFPSTPTKSSKKAASTAKRTSKRATRKTSATAKRTGAAKAASKS